MKDVEPILKHFEYSHLPPDLQAVSKIFSDAVYTFLERVPVRSAERSAREV